VRVIPATNCTTRIARPQDCVTRFVNDLGDDQEAAKSRLTDEAFEVRKLYRRPSSMASYAETVTTAEWRRLQKSD
jgi:hypothetical protein